MVLEVDYTSEDAPARVAQSIRETGFAVITEHPIPWELVASTYDEWARFFDSDVKSAYPFQEGSEGQWGYFPLLSENAKDSELKDLKEFYHVYRWAPLPAGVSDNTRVLHDELERLAGTLLGWIDDNTPEDVKAGFTEPLRGMIEGSQRTLFRVLHYPPIDGDVPPGAVRSAAHEDINLLTLLPAGTAPGLQVLDTAGNWHDVACDPSAIIVNAGDMLQMASGGFYRSTTHRVVNPDGELSSSPRYSMPLFLHPRPEVRLSEAHTAGTYLEERLREIGLKTAG
jgi:isopenicillin N synthase-like dioxygenase